MKALVKMNQCTLKLHYFIVDHGETFTCDKYAHVNAGEADNYLNWLTTSLEDSTAAKTFVKDESLRWYSPNRIIMLSVTIFEKPDNPDSCDDTMYFLRPSIKTTDNGYVAVRYDEDLVFMKK